MKLTEKQANFISVLLMVIIMTAVVSLVMSLLNQNFILIKWLKGWTLSFIVAFPTILVVMPFTKKLVSKLVK